MAVQPSTQVYLAEPVMGRITLTMDSRIDIPTSSAPLSVMFVTCLPGLGGANRSLLELVANLEAQSNVRPTLVVPFSNSAIMEMAQALNAPILHHFFPYIVLKSSPTKLVMMLVGFARGCIQFCALLRRQRPALLHANGTKTAICVLLPCLLTRTPLVYHVRDYPRHKAIEQVLARASLLRIAPSAFIVCQLKANTGACSSRIEMIPNGVRHSAPNRDVVAQLKNQLRIDEAALIVTMVAQFARWKRHDLLIKAVAQLPEHLRNRTRVLLVGDDLWPSASGCRNHIQELAKACGLNEHVMFLGERTDVPEILAISDIVVLPSECEPFGRVVVEAWHQRRATVVSDDAGPASLVFDGKTGMHFQAGDAKSLSAALRTLLTSDVLRTELGDAGYIRASAYSVEIHACAIAALYRKVLDEGWIRGHAHGAK